MAFLVIENSGLWSLEMEVIEYVDCSAKLLCPWEQKKIWTYFVCEKFICHMGKFLLPSSHRIGDRQKISQGEVDFKVIHTVVREEG